MSKPVILWLRRDLRLSDNPALVALARLKAPIIPLYIHDTREQGGPYPGAASAWWLHHSLKALDAPVVTRAGDTVTVLADVIRETGATAVYWNRRYEPKAIELDTKIKAALKKDGLDAQSFKGQVLFEPWDIKTQSGGPFRVFTPYYKACLNHEAMIGEVLRKPAGIQWHGMKSDELGLLPAIKWDREFYDHWTPGEDGAHARLHSFIDEAMAGYKTERDRPDRDGTSRLSPHLHFGDISPRQVWHAALPHTGSAAFLREVIWREFSIHLLFNNPHLPTKPLQEKFAGMPWRTSAKDLQAWQRGMTGFPIVDAGMRQLWRTGWMHNRVRMIVASFLVKHLLLPWQDGEKWFWDTLVDADLANNSASWQWVAGCGADAAPYFRVFNPILQGEKFDPRGDYVRAFVPELKDVPDKFIHKPWDAKMRLDYPAPIVDHAAGRMRALDAFAHIRKSTHD